MLNMPFSKKTTAPTLGRSSATSLLALLLAALFGASCGDDGAEKAPPAAPKESLEEREEKARVAYGAAYVAPYPEKLEMMTLVAHLYWDTKTGPDAMEQVVLGCLDEHLVDAARGLKELEFFERRRPDHPKILSAGDVMTLGIQNFLANRKGDERTEEWKKLHVRAATIWADACARFLKDPRYAKDPIIHQGLGRAYNELQEFAKAEEAFAGVETIVPPAADLKRFESFMRRGEIAEQKLGDKKKALEMFRRAAALSGALDTTADANWGEYVRGKVRELGAEK